jgi:hypothetical protein
VVSELVLVHILVWLVPVPARLSGWHCGVLCNVILANYKVSNAGTSCCVRSCDCMLTFVPHVPKYIEIQPQTVDSLETHACMNKACSAQQSLMHTCHGYSVEVHPLAAWISLMKWLKLMKIFFKKVYFETFCFCSVLHNTGVIETCKFWHKIFDSVPPMSILCMNFCLTWIIAAAASVFTEVISLGAYRPSAC